MRPYPPIKAFAICFFLVACTHTKRPLPPAISPGPALGDAAAKAGVTGQSINQSASNISDSANVVKSNASIAETKIGPSDQAAVKAHLDIIISEAENIIKETDDIAAGSIEITKLGVHLQSLALAVASYESNLKAERSKNEKLQKELDQAVSDKTAALRKSMMYMVIAGAIIIAICVTLFFTGNPKAIGGALAGLILISVAMAIMAITKYMWLFGVIVSVGALIVIGVMIHHMVDYLNHKRGLEEVVFTGEEAKKQMSTDLREKIYGREGESGRAGQIQSRKTEDLVKRVKNKMRSNNAFC